MDDWVTAWKEGRPQGAVHLLAFSGVSQLVVVVLYSSQGLQHSLNNNNAQDFNQIENQALMGDYYIYLPYYPNQNTIVKLW